MFARQLITFVSSVWLAAIAQEIHHFATLLPILACHALQILIAQRLTQFVVQMEPASQALPVALLQIVKVTR